MGLERDEACDAVLAGYRDALAEGGRPIVLAGGSEALAKLVTKVLASGPESWWADLFDDELLAPSRELDRIPDGARAALEAVLPAPGWVYETRRRVAGVGSLGRRRLVLVGEHAGAPVARELKQLALPAGRWLGRPASDGVALTSVVRSHDPFLHVAAGWVARRLAPDCIKLDLAAAPSREVERRLLGWMGAETANIHLADPDAAAAVNDDVDGRKRNWLRDAAVQMARATRDDHSTWRKKNS